MPAADSTRVVHVQPVTAPGPDNETVSSTFSSIQSALDAVGGDRGRATVCVADGTYYEELRVPADTHVIAAGAVRIRPPQTRSDALPTDVDRTLITIETGSAGPVLLEGLDVRYGGVCLRVEGTGAAEVTDSVLQACAVGAIVDEASLTLRDTPLIENVHLGAHVTNGTFAVIDSELLRNGRPALGFEQDALPEPAEGVSWAEGLPGRGALYARGSDVRLLRAVVDENQYEGGVLDVEGGSITIGFSTLGAQRAPLNDEGFLAGEAGGDGPLVRVVNATVRVDGLIARSESQTLFDLEGAGTTLHATDVNWYGRSASNIDGAAGPIIDARDTGELVLRHGSFFGPEGAPGVRLTGQVGIPLTIANSVLWGHGSGAGVITEGATHPVEASNSLFADFSVDGTDLLSGVPGWDEDGEVLTPGSDSILRCAGADLTTSDEDDDAALASDVLGNPRPYQGTTPDVGAVEVQLACP